MKYEDLNPVEKFELKMELASRITREIRPMVEKLDKQIKKVALDAVKQAQAQDQQSAKKGKTKQRKRWF